MSLQPENARAALLPYLSDTKHLRSRRHSRKLGPRKSRTLSKRRKELISAASIRIDAHLVGKARVQRTPRSRRSPPIRCCCHWEKFLAVRLRRCTVMRFRDSKKAIRADEPHLGSVRHDCPNHTHVLRRPSRACTALRAIALGNRFGEIYMEEIRDSAQREPGDLQERTVRGVPEDAEECRHIPAPQEQAHLRSRVRAAPPKNRRIKNKPQRAGE